MQLNVMTYNIRHGKGTDGQVNLNRIADIIRSSKADIVGLNEVDRCFSKRSGFTDQINELAKMTGMYHTFASALKLKSSRVSDTERQYGNGLLSRYPVVESNPVILPHLSRFNEHRSLLEASVEIANRTFTCFVSHLSLNPYMNRIQVDFMMEKVASEMNPLILMGDLNLLPGTRSWKKLTSTLLDVCNLEAERSCLTFPSIKPGIQLDYIFASKQWQVVSSGTIAKQRASDHLPLLATIEITQP